MILLKYLLGFGVLSNTIGFRILLNLSACSDHYWISSYLFEKPFNSVVNHPFVF